MGSKMTYEKWNLKNVDAFMRHEPQSPLPSHIKRFRNQAFDLLVKRGFPRTHDVYSLEGKSRTLAELRDHLVKSITSKQDLRNVQATSFKGIDKELLLYDLDDAHNVSLVPRKTIHKILFLIRAGVKQSKGFIPRSYHSDYLAHPLFEYAPLKKPFSSLSAAVRAGFQPGEDRVYAANLFSKGVSNSSLKTFNRMDLHGKQLLNAAYLETTGLSPKELKAKLETEYERWRCKTPEDRRRARGTILRFLVEQAENRSNRKK